MTGAQLVGINHVALEVDDLERAIAFWRAVFDVRSVEYEPNSAFVDMGDQFVALFEPGAGDEGERHFGLVVDDKERTRESLGANGAEILPGHRLDFRDPFGNRIQVVQYDQVQFTKSNAVLAGLGLAPDKTEAALAELRAKGLS